MPPPWALEGEDREREIESQECLSERGCNKTARAPLKQTSLAFAQYEKAWALKYTCVSALHAYVPADAQTVKGF